MLFVTCLGFVLPTACLLAPITCPDPKENARLNSRVGCITVSSSSHCIFSFLDGKVDVGHLKTSFVVVSMYQNMFFAQDIVHVNFKKIFVTELHRKQANRALSLCTSGKDVLPRGAV